MCLSVITTRRDKKMTHLPNSPFTLRLYREPVVSHKVLAPHGGTIFRVTPFAWTRPVEPEDFLGRRTAPGAGSSFHIWNDPLALIHMGGWCGLRPNPLMKARPRGEIVG